MIMQSKFIAAIVFSFIFHVFANAVNPGSIAKNELYELKIRGGLPNFFNKAFSGDSLRIAYLGGSITEQKGWRVYSFQWLKENFPQAGFSEINATIGGTGSDFGVFRLKEHVLNFNPDLVFIEFAVNDFGKDPEKTLRSLEGIVRQIKKTLPKTEICFIYTVRIEFLVLGKTGQLPESIVISERVANHYKIPSINFGKEVCRQVERNELIFRGNNPEIEGKPVFSPDGVHPYPETGHRLYHQIFSRSLEAIFKEKKNFPVSEELPPPIDILSFSESQMVDLSIVELNGDWELTLMKNNPELERFDKYFRKVGKASANSESITVRFYGDTIGFVDILGPEAAKVVIEIDGGYRDMIPRFDKYCSYNRINYFLVNLEEKKEHIVTFYFLSDPFDKAEILSQNKDMEENPEKYEKNNWYVVKILINGQIL